MTEKDSEYILKDKKFEGSYEKTVFEALRYSFAPHLVFLLFLIVLGFAGRLSLFLISWVIGIWADSLTQGQIASGSSRVIPEFFMELQSKDFIFLLSFLAAVSFMLNLAYRIPFTRTGAKGVSRLYDAVTERTSRLPQSFFDRTPVGRIISRFSSDYGAVLRMAGGPLGEFVVIIFDLILLVVLISVTSVAMIPLVLMTILINFFVYRVNRKNLRDSRRQMSLTRGPAIAHFAETGQGHASIRLFDKAETFENRFINLRKEYLESRLHVVSVIQRFSFQMVLSTASLLLFTGLIGLFMYSMGLLSIGQFSVSFTFVTMLSSTTQQFFDYLGRFDEALTGIERLGEYLSLELEPGSQNLGVDAAAMPPNSTQARVQTQTQTSNPAHGCIEVRSLRMRYRADSSLVLDDLNFKILPGEKFGIIGRTGSGKSSFLNALMYLYPFDSGYIAVNGCVPGGMVTAAPQGFPLNQVFDSEKLQFQSVPLVHYRTQMAFIAQEPVLFRGSLRENLSVADRKISDQEMTQALINVGLGAWLKSYSLPVDAPLDFFVSESGGNLSAGQRQLICMARAILEDAPIVIMDEATSFVDPLSEEKFVRATKELFVGKTQIIVAHRLSTLTDCDRILWLENARIRELGPANEVLKKFREAVRSEDSGQSFS